MPQFDDRSDGALNSLEKKLSETIDQQAKLQEKFDLFWMQIFHEFDLHAGEGVSASFVCDDGYRLARIVPEMQPVVNNDRLQQIINETFTAEEARLLWNRVTVPTRVVLQNKLAQEIKKNERLALAVHEAGDVIVTPTRKPSRSRKQATKKEMAVLSVKNFKAAAGGEA